jgi:ArsR family transcriptional regulator
LSKQIRENYRRQAGILKALANESRLMIVDQLNTKPHTAGELTRLVGLDQSTVSKHLAILRAHGIIHGQRQGLEVKYELVCKCVTGFLTCAVQVLRER